MNIILIAKLKSRIINLGNALAEGSITANEYTQYVNECKDEIYTINLIGRQL